MQRAIRAVLMRGGSSKGLYLRAHELPPPGPARDAVLLRLYGSPDKRQIDGTGGADVLTSKVDILSHKVDYGGNCGNISAGVGPYAIEQGLCALPAAAPETTVRIHNTNTGAVLRSTVQLDWATGRAAARVEGDCAIGGVPGYGSPIELDFSSTQGSVTGALLPTGQRTELLPLGGRQIEASLLDAGQPTVFIRAEALGLDPSADPAEWGAVVQPELRGQIERIRGEAAVRMGIVSRWEQAVTDSAYTPFVVLVGQASGRNGSADSSMQALCVFMQQVHKAYPVTGSVATAAAAMLPGTVVHDCAAVEGSLVRIRHPSGVMEVRGQIKDGDSPELVKASITRTARKLFEGEAYVPWAVWPKDE